MQNRIETRENWLNSATDALRAHFQSAGYTVPINVKATCGFPSRSATSRKAQRIGECWDSGASAGSVFEIFISPVLADSETVAATLAHELVHATVGLAAKHNAPFKQCALAIGLEGKMTATVAGPAFKAAWANIAPALGEYPHAVLNATSGGKKQTTRLLKVECPECKAEGNAYICRMSASALELGAPICPTHNEPMQQSGGA